MSDAAGFPVSFDIKRRGATCATVAGIASLALRATALGLHAWACKGDNSEACGQIGWDAAGVVLGLLGWRFAKMAAEGLAALGIGAWADRIAENCAGLGIGSAGLTVSAADWYLTSPQQPGLGAANGALAFASLGLET